VECVIHLGERLSNPTITFDVRVPGSDPETQSLIANALSTPETVDTQFLYLLLFNSFMSENSSQASSNIGSSVSAATGLEFVRALQGGLQRRLDLVHGVDVEHRVHRRPGPLDRRTALDGEAFVDDLLERQHETALRDRIVAVHLENIGLGVDLEVQRARAAPLDRVARHFEFGR